MPPTIKHFSSPGVVIPPRVYLDTSFILRSYSARAGVPIPSLTERAKNNACIAFLARLNVSETHLSLFTVEEAIHTAYFKFHIMRIANRHGYQNRWKDFRRDLPTDFQNARIQGIQEVKRLAAFLDSLPIKLIESNTYIQRTNSIAFVIKYAKLALEKYAAVEAMDSFHIALMRVNRIDWFVTAEQHLAPGFDEFSVLTL